MSIIKLIQKYWVYISVSFTIISSLGTGAWYIKGKIDDLTSQVAATNSWVQDHDDDIQALHDDVLKLKTLEEAREKGICR